MLGFVDTPDFNSSFRFLTWSMSFATAIVTAHYARLTSGVLVPAITLWGATVYHVGLGFHQFYYWAYWRARGDQDAALLYALSEIRHVTTFFLLIMVVGGVLMMQPLLKQYASNLWPLAGLVSVLTIWAVGYGDARWL